MKAIRYTGGQGTFAENQYGKWIVDDATFGARKVGSGEGEVPEAAAEELVNSGQFEYVKGVTAAGATKKAVLSVEKAFKALDKGHAGLSKSRAAGKATAEETAALGETWEGLKASIAATYGSLAQAPAKIQKRFEAAEKAHGAIMLAPGQPPTP